MESDKDEQASDSAPTNETDGAGESTLPLNRAERRALEHKKGKTAASGSPGGFGAGAARPTGRFAGGPGKSRLPRTGHK